MSVFSPQSNAVISNPASQSSSLTTCHVIAAILKDNMHRFLIMSHKHSQAAVITCSFTKELELIVFNSHKNSDFFTCLLLLLLHGDDSDVSNFITTGSSVLIYTSEIPALI